MYNDNGLYLRFIGIKRTLSIVVHCNMKNWVKSTKNKISIISRKNHPPSGFEPKTTHSQSATLLSVLYLGLSVLQLKFDYYAFVMEHQKNMLR